MRQNSEKEHFVFSSQLQSSTAVQHQSSNSKCSVPTAAAGSRSSKCLVVWTVNWSQCCRSKVVFRCLFQQRPNLLTFCSLPPALTCGQLTSGVWPKVIRKYFKEIERLTPHALSVISFCTLFSRLSLLSRHLLILMLSILSTSTKLIVQQQHVSGIYSNIYRKNHCQTPIVPSLPKYLVEFTLQRYSTLLLVLSILVY